MNVIVFNKVAFSASPAVHCAAVLTVRQRVRGVVICYVVMHAVTEIVLIFLRDHLTAVRLTDSHICSIAAAPKDVGARYLVNAVMKNRSVVSVFQMYSVCITFYKSAVVNVIIFNAVAPVHGIACKILRRQPYCRRADIVNPVSDNIAVFAVFNLKCVAARHKNFTVFKTAVVGIKEVNRFMNCCAQLRVRVAFSDFQILKADIFNRIILCSDKSYRGNCRAIGYNL